MQLLVICHGETGYENSNTVLGWVDKALSEQGVLTVNQYASFLIQQQEQIDMVITSPLTRARQTGLIISKGLNTRLIENELIKDRNYGEVSGTAIETFKEKYPTIENLTDVELFDGFPKSELTNDVKARVKKFVHFLIQLRNGGRYQKVMVVTHSIIVRLILQALREYSDEEMKELPVNPLSKFEIEI